MRHAFVVSLLCAALPVFAQAAAYAPTVQSEKDYQQAIVIFDQAEPELNRLTALIAEGTPASALEPQLNALGTRYQPALERLTVAAGQGHAVAQYRLALHYWLYSKPQTDTEVCPLLESSLKQGFAPAVLLAQLNCGLYQQPRNGEVLQQALERLPVYAAYYPQPATMLECTAQNPKRTDFSWGSQNDFGAELYRLLGAEPSLSDAQKLDYLHKAVAANDCIAAKRRIPRLLNRLEMARTKQPQ